MVIIASIEIMLLEAYLISDLHFESFLIIKFSDKEVDCRFSIIWEKKENNLKTEKINCIDKEKIEV